MKRAAFVSMLVLTLGAPLTYPDDDLQSVIEEIEGAENGMTRRMVDRATFPSASMETLAELKSHDSNTVAFRAAWEHVLRTFPEGLDAEAVQVNREAIQRFLGFVEGRLAVTVPSWWEDSLLTMTGNRYSQVFADPPEWGKLLPVDGPTVLVPEGIEFAVLDGKIIVSSEEGEVVLPHTSDEVFAGTLSSISLAFTDDEMIYALIPNNPFDYQLQNIDRETAETTWTATVWAGSPLGYMGPPDLCVADIVVTSDTVIVFGMDYRHGYVEAFDRNDGNVRFRFCTSY